MDMTEANIWLRWETIGKELYSESDRIPITSNFHGYYQTT